MNYRSFLKALCSVLVLCFSFVACEPEPPVTGGGNTGGGNTGGGNTGNKVTYSESGLYMGITGFNTDVKRYVYDSRYFRILSESSATDFKNFVNGLNIDMATVLYYAVDDALTNMEGARFPDDLNNVAIVTFTDGLDQGSPYFGDQYANANAVNQHLLSARVNNLPITGYAIGLKGKDVKDDAKFKANLTALSTSPANALEVKDMNEVDAIFQEIAASLYNETQSQSISLTVPMQADGVKTRFTFEGNLANESQSNCYIEGTWSDGTLTSITYVGMTCSSGSTVKATANGVLFTFTFEDVKKGSDGKGGELSTDKAQVWNQDPGSSWTPNSEFDPSKYSQTIVEQKSALIMLVLDCSSSLGEEGLSQIKNAANNFIETLRKATSPDYCKVAYDANRGSGNMSTQLFKKGSAQALNANTFTREGYKFAGWNTQPDGTGTHYTDQQKVTLNGNTTLYAQWNAAYTVTFDANGGNGTMQSQPFEHGKSQKLTSNSFTRSGYTFTGWNTKADGSGTSYTNGQTITPTSNLMLYAQWKKDVIYTITFNANEGSGTMSALTVKEGASQKLTSNSFTRSGYTFTGWNTKADGSGTSYTNGQTITPTSNLTLYAQWKKTYTITFNANGGIGAMSALTVKEGASQKLTSNSFTRSGYTFTGWNTKADGSGTSYTNGQIITPTANLTLYAQWKKDVIYTITFNANGGSGTMSALSVKEGASQKLTSNSFTRSGYTFTGWNTKADGSGTPYTNGQTITPTANLTLYAQWKATSGTTAGHDWVDLGLSVKWATTNVGASKPEGYGNLYDMQDDLQNLKTIWGTAWRMPKQIELEELIDKCTWKWTTQNGVEGCKVTGPNGNSVFLPAAGWYSVSGYYSEGEGCYWADEIDADFWSTYLVVHRGSPYITDQPVTCRFSVRLVLN